MSFLEQIGDAVSGILCSDFASFLADEMGIDHGDVKMAIEKYIKKPKLEPIKIIPLKKNRVTKSASSGKKVCEFIPTSGKGKGIVCGTEIRGEGDYCSKHKNRKSLGGVYKIELDKDEGTDRWIIKGTHFVLRSAIDKTIVGKIKDGKVFKLTVKDREECEKYKQK